MQRTETTCQGQLQYFFKFDSLAELVDESRKVRHLDPDHLGEAHYKQRSFIGRSFTGFEDAAQALNSNWKHGMEVIERMLDELRSDRLPVPHNIRRRSAWSEESGDEICLDRLKVGQPYWRTTRRDHRPGPMHVTICANIGANSDTAADLILWRGAAAVCLTELLEQAGYRVELIGLQSAVHAFEHRREGWANSLTMKRPEEPLDISTLTNALSGWAFRTIWFTSALISGKPFTDSSLGKDASITHLLPLVTSDEHAIVANNLWGHRDAVNWVRKQLEAFDHA
jgi:hypothetical protein